MDRILVTDLRVMCLIGALDHEQDAPQPLQVDLKIDIDLTEAGLSDDLDHTVNYGAVAEQIDELARQQRFVLLERFAEMACNVVLSFERVKSVEAKVTKLRPPVPVAVDRTSVVLRRRRKTPGTNRNGPMLFAQDRVLTIDSPMTMAVLNATPDSFSDVVDMSGIAQQTERLHELISSGAHVIDIGAQSANTAIEEISIDEEIERLLPILSLAVDTGRLVSVDTYRHEVAEAACSKGAHIINDTSALSDPHMADVVAHFRCGYVYTHNAGRPKQRLTESDHYLDVDGGVVGDVLDRFSSAIEQLGQAGVAPEQIVLDFGPDFGKTPHQTLSCLQACQQFAALGRPLLFALSRKDIWGAALNLGPTERDAASLAAFVWAAERVPSSIMRTHRPSELSQALQTRALLDGMTGISTDLRLPVHLRRIR